MWQKYIVYDDKVLKWLECYNLFLVYHKTVCRQPQNCKLSGEINVKMCIIEKSKKIHSKKNVN